MRTEKQKMLAGELYDPGDPQLVEERKKAQRLCYELRAIDPSNTDKKVELLTQLFGKQVNVSVTLPFFCDYGTNIEFGNNVYFNFNCVLLDVCLITIGDNVLFGPAVQIYTATHPISAEERKTGLELGKPITIESDVWVGGGSVICPGVSIGQGTVIGAGSVVSRSIPANVIAVGNPCKVLRQI